MSPEKRDYLTVKVSSEGPFKDKNNGANILNLLKYGQIITRERGLNSNQFDFSSNTIKPYSFEAMIDSDLASEPVNDTDTESCRLGNTDW